MAAPRRALGVRALVAATAVLTPLAALAGIAGLAAASSDTTGEAAHTMQATSAASVPARASAAYQRAGGRCVGLDWTLLAAVGAVETRHGQVHGATVKPDSGEAHPWIFGPPLDGHRGTAAIPIGRWTGWWGLSGPWTQAVGPMQFLPSTFERHAVDGDGDRVANPHDFDDAAATASAYLCTAGGGSLDGPAEVARIYNPGHPSYSGMLQEEQRRIRDSVANSSSAHRDVGTGTTCPVAGAVQFTDTFGAPRSGGRTHQGVDMFAAAGTPVAAPADGTVEHYHNDLGGLSYRLYADDGTYYYGTHLSGYENVGAGHIGAGTIIGYVGDTGNAAGTPPHLHWEIHPGGRGTAAINPTPTAETLCGRRN